MFFYVFFYTWYASSPRLVEKTGASGIFVLTTTTTRRRRRKKKEKEISLSDKKIQLDQNNKQDKNWNVSFVDLEKMSSISDLNKFLH
jgi:hypothetical protein